MTSSSRPTIARLISLGTDSSSGRYASVQARGTYITKAYLPAAQTLRKRLAGAAELAKGIAGWERRVRQAWASLHIGAPAADCTDGALSVTVPVYLGDMAADDVHVEIYADPRQDGEPEILKLVRGEPIAGALNGYVYSGSVRSTRPAEDFTVRIVPYHPDVRIPSELPLILWQK